MTIQKYPIVDGSSCIVKSSRCTVTERHISEMYDRFESGLCDQSTCNAVALALKEMTGRKIRVFRRHGLALVQTESSISELPIEVFRWLEEVDRGIVGKPFQFDIEINSAKP